MDIEKLIERLKEPDCDECTYEEKRECAGSAKCVLSGYAAEAFSTLQTENEKLLDENRRWSEATRTLSCAIENLRAELEQVKRCIKIIEKQRDAAIKELENYMVQDVLDGNEPCGICAKASDIPCEYCNPKWSGPKED